MGQGAELGGRLAHIHGFPAFSVRGYAPLLALRGGTILN